MSYYTALINAWNGATQPPTGVTGTALTGLTTANKLIAVNGWTVTGSVPTSFFTTADALLNCINYTEFNLLTAQEKSDLWGMLNVSGQLLGGSGQTSHMAAGMIVDFFLTKHSGPNTIAALTALAQAVTQPWWQANAYPRQFDMGDVTTAGLS